MTVRGVDKLRAVARDLRIAGDKDMLKELRSGILAAVRPLPAAIKAEVPKLMPSGYAPVLARAITARTSTRMTGSTVGVSVVVQAKGQKDQRDLPTIDAGKLRHPVFGRYRKTRRGRQKNPWVAQRVRPGVVGRPVDRVMGRVVAEAEAAVDRIAEKIERGG